MRCQRILNKVPPKEAPSSGLRPLWSVVSPRALAIGLLIAVSSHLGEVLALPSTGPLLAPTGRSHPVWKTEALVIGKNTGLRTLVGVEEKSPQPTLNP
jgi:hypothetical protein